MPEKLEIAFDDQPSLQDLESYVVYPLQSNKIVPTPNSLNQLIWEHANEYPYS